MTKNYCHDFSPHSSREVKKLNHVELLIVQKKIEADARWVRNSTSLRITSIPFESGIFSVAWQKRGTKDNKSNRPIIRWETAFVHQALQPKSLHSLTVHVIAGGIVTFVATIGKQILDVIQKWF